jgi:hypothetical protein
MPPIRLHGMDRITSYFTVQKTCDDYILSMSVCPAWYVRRAWLFFYFVSRVVFWGKLRPFSDVKLDSPVLEGRTETVPKVCLSVCLSVYLSVQLTKRPVRDALLCTQTTAELLYVLINMHGRGYSVTTATTTTATATATRYKRMWKKLFEYYYILEHRKLFKKLSL